MIRRTPPDIYNLPALYGRSSGSGGAPVAGTGCGFKLTNVLTLAAAASGDAFLRTIAEDTAPGFLADVPAWRAPVSGMYQINARGLVQPSSTPNQHGYLGVSVSRWHNQPNDGTYGISVTPDGASYCSALALIQPDDTAPPVIYAAGSEAMHLFAGDLLTLRYQFRSSKSTGTTQAQFSLSGVQVSGAVSRCEALLEGPTVAGVGDTILIANAVTVPAGTTQLSARASTQAGAGYGNYFLRPVGGGADLTFAVQSMSGVREQFLYGAGAVPAGVYSLGVSLTAGATFSDMYVGITPTA